MEMEAAIIRHPKIAEAAVHAVASSASEDDVKVCVVLADRVSATPQELFEFFRRELPFYAMPRYVEVLDALPRNAVGRVMKYQLRERPLSEGVWDFERLGLRVDPSQRRATS
jgi:crotonobetaine/carnitine-CoA ligase